MNGHLAHSSYGFICCVPPGIAYMQSNWLITLSCTDRMHAQTSFWSNPPLAVRLETKLEHAAATSGSGLFMFPRNRLVKSERCSVVQVGFGGGVVPAWHSSQSKKGLLCNLSPAPPSRGGV